MARWLLAVVVLCVVFGVAGCGRGADLALLREAERAVQAREWESALESVKAFLLRHPENAGGHLLLGQCYLHMPTPALDVAQGEFNTAMYLFEKTGSMGGINVPTAEQFQSIVHTELAVSYLRALYEEMDRPRGRRALAWLAAQSLDHTRKARALYDNAYLEELETTLEQMDLGRPRPEAPVAREQVTTLDPE